jgi:Zn ribbon nucleic-acid-binding protein
VTTAREHDYEISCSCGNRWRLQASEEPDTVECVACGAHASQIVDLGQIRPSY